VNYQQVLETIKDRIDIVNLVSERVSLKRRGRNFVGLCPFHAEKTPSFTVSPEKQMFYCFGCGAGGDAITFWMKIENLDFRDAVKDLADRLGIELPRERPKGPSKWEAYHGINRAVKEYFAEILFDKGRGRAALAYLRKRGLALETIRTFELGYAPGSYGLSEFVEKRGFDPADAAALGLLKKVNEKTFVPVFRNRVIFPILDERGRTVGFGGRALGEAQPKYLNSPDAMIFQKGRLLYGEAQSKREIARQRKAILVEGYMDLISLHQLGIKNGIAALGTAFTDAHATRLKRWADQVVMLFDGDAAGFRASSRALEKLVRAGLVAYQGVLPEGKDPGDYLGPPDGNELKGIIEEAKDAILFRVRRAAAAATAEGIEEREKRVKEALAFFQLIRDPVRLDLYVTEASKILGLQKEDLYGIIKNSRNAYNKRRRYSSPPGGFPGKGAFSAFRGRGRPVSPGKRMEDAEEVLLISLIQCPELSREMEHKGILEMFGNEALKALGKSLLEEIRDRGSVEPSGMSLRMDDEKRSLLSRLALKTHDLSDGQAKKAFSDSLKVLYQRRYREEIARLDEQIKALEKDEDFAKTIALLKRREAMMKDYKKLIQNHDSR